MNNFSLALFLFRGVTAVMGIRKKCDSNFILTFVVAKVRYSGITMTKIFVKNLLLLIVSVSTMQCYIINNISKKQALNILLTKCSSLQIFIRLYLQTLSNFIICSKIEMWTSLVENRRSFYATKLCHICLCVYHARWII